jgi:hypothetical protein
MQHLVLKYKQDGRVKRIIYGNTEQGKTETYAVSKVSPTILTALKCNGHDARNYSRGPHKLCFVHLWLFWHK